MAESQDESKAYLNEINFGDAEAATGAEKAEAEKAEAEQIAAQAELEKRAADIGWKPKDQWKGDTEKWVDAETYLKRGEEIMPILKHDRDRLFKKISDLEGKLNTWEVYHKSSLERTAKREYDRGLQELREQQRKAVETGDAEAFDKIEKERESLQQKLVDEQAQTSQTARLDHPEIFRNWMTENSWYQEDGSVRRVPMNDMTRFAQLVAPAVLVSNPAWNGTEPEFLDAVKEEVKRKFPDRFTNKRAFEPSAVETGRGISQSASSKRKAFSDLPPDAQKEALKMKKIGLKLEDYVNEYFGQTSYTSEE